MMVVCSSKLCYWGYPRMNLVTLGKIAAVYGTVVFLRLTNNIRAKAVAKRATISRKAARQTQFENMKMELLTENTALKEKRRLILKNDFKDLAENLKRKTYSCVEVLEAYQEKALEVQEQLNCICNFIDEAKEWASGLDEMNQEGSQKLPLYGIPVSIKENIKIAGYDSTMGLAKFLNHPSSEDSGIVSILKELGAVPFVVTNVPQTLLSIGCSNPIYGETKNPVNEDRTPGGSSGGEAALIKAGGSILGIGSDIGGSIRIPAHFSGIVGLKPSSNRITSKNTNKSINGVQGVYGVTGLMGKDVSSVMHLFRSVTEYPGSVKHDATMLKMPYVSKFPPNFCIGYYEELELFPATEPCKRAVREIVNLLQEKGYEVREHYIDNIQNILKRLLALALADQGEQHLELWKNEVISNSVVMNKFAASLSNFSKVLICKTLLRNSPNRQIFLNALRGITVGKLWEEMAYREKYIQRITESWQSRGISVMLSPVMPFPAILPKNVSDLISGTQYCSMYNYFDFPSGSVPVTTVTPRDVTVTKEKYPVRQDTLFPVVREDLDYDSVGLPVGVQVTGLPYREDVVLQTMKLIEDIRYGRI